MTSFARNKLNNRDCPLRAYLYHLHKFHDSLQHCKFAPCHHDKTIFLPWCAERKLELSSWAPQKRICEILIYTECTPGAMCAHFARATRGMEQKEQENEKLKRQNISNLIINKIIISPFVFFYIKMDRMREIKCFTLLTRL